MEIKIDIGERLSELLSENDISAEALAEELGVNASTVRRWKRGAKYMRLGNAVAIANRFGCSLEFLTGRSDTFIDFSPHPAPPFYPHLRELMKEKGISRNRINRETHIRSSHFVDWSKGADPNITSALELADYLDVSLDILTGRDR